MDCVIEDPRWQTLALEDIAARALQATLAHLDVPDHAEVSLLGCDDARIAVLNADFREKPTATNVLSWPSEDLAPVDPGAMPAAPTADFDGSLELGDIAISYDTCTAEARAAGIPAPHHVAHLLVHGILHLLGYDHIRDPDATLMERTEVEILGKMGIDNPYCVSQAE